jgi:hypothetical protein
MLFRRSNDSRKMRRDADCMRLQYHVPLPLDHFFFCFLPPVAAGAYKIISIVLPFLHGIDGATKHTILSDMVLCWGVSFVVRRRDIGPLVVWADGQDAKLTPKRAALTRDHALHLAKSIVVYAHSHAAAKVGYRSVETFVVSRL